MRRRVLYVVHNHPAVAPGGAEVYALELYRAMRDSAGFEPILLARTGPPHGEPAAVHQGTVLSIVDGDPNQYLFRTDLADFDWLLLTPRSKRISTRFFRDFLRTYVPDLVHFQHSLFFGFDVLTETRNTLPAAPIVYTLHEYLPICHRNGQLLRTRTDEPCMEASPRRCHGCFPDISSQSFFLRKRFIASHLSRVDRFIAPSRFLLERFVDWGIPRDKISYEEYGRLPASQHAEERDVTHRARIGFFGQLHHFKGVTVLLEAMRLLANDDSASSTTVGDTLPRVLIHGANLDFAPDDFQARFHELLEATKTHVTLVGQYEAAHLPRLMANIDWVVVPSIWWENSPLVIQEAFAHGRPVLCSDIGGMAEKVQDGVNGLHFRPNDPASLAATLRRAVSSPGLWDRLRRGIPAVHAMETHVANLDELYRDLLRTRQASLRTTNGS